MPSILSRLPLTLAMVSAPWLWAAAFVPGSSSTSYGSMRHWRPLPISSSGMQQTSRCSPLYGISEWRDQALLVESRTTTNQETEILRQLPIHVVDSKKVALQGEMLYFQFTQDDEVRLFQQAIDCHQGIFGLGFYNDEDDKGGILYDKISLVEIKDYNMMGGDYGIFLSVQVVGRAIITEHEVSRTGASSISATTSQHQHQQQQYHHLQEEEDERNHYRNREGEEKKQPVVALCAEIMNSNEDEQRSVTLAEATEMAQAVERLIADLCSVENGCYSGSHRDEAQLSPQQRQEEEDDDRWDRYRDAYHRAIESDTLGYTYSARDTKERHSSRNTPAINATTNIENDDSQHLQLYTWKELNAISWAAFSTSACLRQDETYRLAALDNDCVTNRLLLATYWLSDVLQHAQQQQRTV